MYTMEDLKTNRDAQITVGSIVFFLLAFPIYFGFAAGNADGSLSGSVVADYKVNGELTYVQLDSGTEYVADGTPWMDTFNTDAVDNADEMNIVGLRVSLSYGEDETGRPAPPCLSQTAADTITGTATHLNFTGTGEGQNGGADGSHEVTAEWYNSSMVGGEVIEGLSMDDIKEQIDSMGAGLGDHTVEISVAAQGGSCLTPIGGDNEDNGEEVSYVVELIVFDYTIVPFIEVQAA